MAKWTPEQQAEHRRAWIKALRSKEYQQVIGALRKDIGGTPAFCCLGVACDLYLKSGDAPKKARWELDGTAARFYYGGRKVKDYFNTPYEPSFDSDLPKPVQDWLGLASSGGEFVDKRGDPNNLISKNDDDKWSFKKIANLIEKEPKGLIKDAK